MTDFSLRALVRNVLDETDLTSPDEIAEKVAASIPKDQLRAVLAMTLRDFVRVEMTRVRSAGQNDDKAQPRPANRSAKVTAIRDAAPKWMRERVYVGTTWKLLAECTYDNLMFLVADRSALAAQNSAAADRYQKIADAVKRARVACVADLSKAAITRLESVAA
jgi:hypothetical protein